MDIASLLVTILGVLLTVAALGVAIAIYQRQNVEQENFRRHVDQRLDGLMARRIDASTKKRSRKHQRPPTRPKLQSM